MPLGHDGGQERRVLLLPQRDEMTRELAQHPAVRFGDPPQPRPAVQRVAPWIQKLPRLATIERPPRKAGDVAVGGLRARLRRKLPEAEEADRKPCGHRDHAGAGSLRGPEKPACPVCNQEEREGEVEIERPVFEVVAADRRDVERVGENDPREDQGHVQRPPATVPGPGRDQERHPEVDGVLEREGPEVAQPQAPPHATPDFHVVGVGEQVAVVDETEQELGPDDPGKQREALHVRLELEGALRAQHQTRGRERADREQGSVGPHPRREPEEPCRERSRLAPREPRLQLDDQAEGARHRQGFEKTRLEPARRPHRDAPGGRQEQGRNDRQPTVLAGATEREPHDHGPECDRRREGHRVRHALRRQADRVECREHQHQQKVAVALDALESGIEDEPMPVGQVTGVAERDEGIVGEKGVMRGVHEQQDEREREGQGTPETHALQHPSPRRERDRNRRCLDARRFSIRTSHADDHR